MAPERLNEDDINLIDIVTNHPEKAVKLDMYRSERRRFFFYDSSWLKQLILYSSFGIILYELRERKEPLLGCRMISF